MYHSEVKVKTWPEKLEQEYVHNPPPSAWVSISSLKALDDCQFFLSSGGSSPDTQRGNALHDIMEGEEVSGIPEAEQNALYEARNKLDEFLFQCGKVEKIKREYPVYNDKWRIQGTADIVVWAWDEYDNPVLGIADFKFGKHPVPATTAQMAGYASCMDEWFMPCHTVIMGIIQPGYPLTTHRTTIRECQERIDKLLKQRDYCLGHQCKYCGRADKCLKLKHKK